MVIAGKKDEAEAILVRTCSASIAAGCGGLGYLYSIRKDWGKARRYLERGCALGDGLVCEGLAQFVSGAEGAPPRSDAVAAYRDALPYYRRACELGVPRTCAFVAAGISDGIVKGTAAEALNLYLKACHGANDTPMACRSAADLLHTGTAESRQLAERFDVERMTKELLTRGCKLGDRECCKAIE
ncbi:MAG: sel1 repeat family protein [Deltaproteobacteria bacterium]|nr:sel1 repeat family protein [Deltaproteobacteria bacterium]